MEKPRISGGCVHYPDRTEIISDLPWAAHQAFQGVYLKTLVKAIDTDGLFSSHLVKINPGCSLAAHIHEHQMELHEVVEGKGTCRLGDQTFDYHPGKMALIPKGKSHMVQAGQKGLTLMAKFFPAMP